MNVRILIDASDTGLFALPFPKGVHHVTESLRALHLDPRYVRFEVAAYPHVLTGNLHVKTVVVDGRRAIITGANPEIHHEGANPWYDLGFQFRGEVAAGLRGEFANAWKHGIQWTCPTWEFYPESCTRPTRDLPALSVPVEPDLADACVPMLVIGRGSDENPLGSGTDNTQDQAYLAAMRGAKSVIRIQTPNMNDDDVKDALLRATANGVDVKIILSRDFNRLSESVPGVGGHNEDNVNELYRRLRAAGVENPCERLQIRWYSQDGVRAQRGNGPGVSHAKYASFDDQVAIVGGTNMDGQSFHRSREADVVVDDQTTVGAWDSVFEERFAMAMPVAPCGGPTPLLPSDSWGKLLERLSLQALNRPRSVPKPFTYFSARIDKQLGLLHLGSGFERMGVRSGSGSTQQWSRFKLLGTWRLGIDRSRFLYTNFEYEHDQLSRMETRLRWSNGLRQQIAPWSTARLELDLGPGITRIQRADGAVRQGLVIDASLRFAWMISRDLALRHEIGAQLGGNLSNLRGDLELSTTLTDRWELGAAAMFRYDRDNWLGQDGYSFDPLFRLRFRYKI